MSVTNDAAQWQFHPRELSGSNRRTFCARHSNCPTYGRRLSITSLPLSIETEALEIGPRTGFTAFRFSRQVRSLTLIDVAAESLSSVRENLASLSNVHCICADPADLGFAANMTKHSM
jgi:hypothetical protein